MGAPQHGSAGYSDRSLYVCQAIEGRKAEERRNAIAERKDSNSAVHAVLRNAFRPKSWTETATIISTQICADCRFHISDD